MIITASETVFVDLKVYFFKKIIYVIFLFFDWHFS